jgi:hypothetical protein
MRNSSSIMPTVAADMLYVFAFGSCPALYCYVRQQRTTAAAVV